MAGSDREEGNGPVDDPSPTGLPSQKRRVSKNPPQTIAGLGLNIEAARGGKPIFLLPVGKRDRDSGLYYPLPYALDELLAVSLIHIQGGSQNATSCYVRRAKREYTKRMAAKSPERLDNAASRAKYVLDDIKNTRKEAHEEIQKIHEDAIRAAATLTDLYGLIRTGSKMILAGFVNGTAVNGEVPDSHAFTNLTGKVLGHIAKLGGITDDDKADAESAVFEAAVMATRQRLKDTESTGTKPEPDEVVN
jgi:hypothetical protein